MNRFEDLPDELLYIIISNLSTNSKVNLREVNNNCNKLLNYMHIKIDNFDEKYKKILIAFKISDNITKYIPIGMITEWQLQFCLRPRHKKNIEQVSKITEREKIKESIYEIGAVFASEWLYEAIHNWSIVENYKY
jgi:hypothetical protein